MTAMTPQCLNAHTYTHIHKSKHTYTPTQSGNEKQCRHAVNCHIVSMYLHRCIIFYCCWFRLSTPTCVGVQFRYFSAYLLSILIEYLQTVKVFFFLQIQITHHRYIYTMYIIFNIIYNRYIYIYISVLCTTALHCIWINQTIT